MRINILMLNQDDPKKCTAAKLVRFGLAKKISVIHYLLSISPKRNLSNKAQILLEQAELTTGWIAISILLMITFAFLCLGAQIFKRREYH